MQLLYQAISLCSRDFDMGWHEKKTFKFVILFYLNNCGKKRVCPKAFWRHSNAMINKSVWWVLHRSGKCGLMKGGLKGRGFPVMAATLAWPGKHVTKLDWSCHVVMIPLRIIFTFSLYFCRVPSEPPCVIGKPAWELGAVKSGQVVQRHIHGGEDERGKSLAL